MSYQSYKPVTALQTAPSFNFVGTLSTNKYGKLLNEYLNGVPLTPVGSACVCLISSITGGTLVFSIGAKISQLIMTSNVEYFVNFPVSVTKILASGTDWQGVVATNDIADLIIKGY